MKIFTANVGVNSGHRFTSPLFDDGTFEFLPIDDEDSPRAVHYRDLRSHYEPNRDLLRYVPERLWDDACHNDPEFETFTYGDAGDNARSSNLTRIGSSDVLLFLARLERWAGDRPTRQFGFYLVGGLLVDYARFVTLDPQERERFARNAHAIRGDEQFLGVAGADGSRRFERAVPVTRELCEKVFTDTNGRSWDWSRQKTEIAAIGSYTRACRCMLDTGDRKQAQRAATLREWIAEHSGDADAGLLETT